MQTLGFIEARSNISLFICPLGSETVYLLLYIDDIVLTTSNNALLQKTILALQREFTMVFDPLHHFLGVTVERRLGGLFLHQHTYLKDISTTLAWQPASHLLVLI
jgi:hypothetical protein